MIAGAFLIAVLAVGTEVLLIVASWLLTPGPRRLPFLSNRSRPVATSEPTASAVPL